MKKLLFTFVFLAAAGGGAYYYFVYNKAPHIPDIMKAPVSEGSITEVVAATGTLQATRTVNVGSQISGVVTEVLVNYNDIVKKGQVLARIDTSLLDTQVAIQNANIARQEVDIASQRVQLEDSQKNLQRQKDLYASKLITQQALEAADLQVKSRVAQIASAEKSMVQTQVALGQAKLNVSYATVKSPIEGVVVNRAVDEGMTVQSSMTVANLFLLAMDLTTLKLEGGVDEADIGKVRQGMPVRFTVEAYPNQEFEGTVTMVRLNPTMQQNVVTYTTVVEAPNPVLKLRVGMTASMKIQIDRKDNVLRVPNAALRFRPNNDMFAALNQEPLTSAAGRAGGAGGRDGGQGGSGATGATGPTLAGAPGRGTAPAAGAPATGQAPANGQQARAGGANPFDRAAKGGDAAGRGGQGGDRTGRGQAGGGRGGMNMTMTPEQMKQMEAIRQLPQDQRRAAMEKAGINFGGGGGRGAGGGGRGGGQRPSANQVTGPVPSITQRNATSIDQLFAPVPRSDTRSAVYTLIDCTAGGTKNEGCKLKRHDIRIGLNDGTFSELVMGDLTVGNELVTNISMPWLVTARPGSTQGNPLMGQQPGRGMPGGMGGMGGGGNPGGGGGGRGGGGR